MTTVTPQEVSALLRRAGFRSSIEGRNSRIGYATRSFGFAVTANGERVYACKSCGTSDYHRPTCTTRSGAAKYWRTRVERDGTVTVTVHGSTTSRYGDHDRVSEAVVAIAATLVQAGYAVTTNAPGVGAPSLTVAANAASVRN